MSSGKISKSDCGDYTLGQLEDIIKSMQELRLHHCQTGLEKLLDHFCMVSIMITASKVDLARFFKRGFYFSGSLLCLWTSKSYSRKCI